MASNLRFSPAIPEEMCSAIASYDEISHDLGNRVRDAFQRLFQMIRDNPALYAVAYDNIRIARAKPFPFLVHYRTTGMGTEVVAIFPAAADPAEWKRTTRNR